MLRTFPSRLPRGAGLFLLLTAPLFAQNHNTPLSQNFKFEQLTIEHGLPHNRVMCILQDSRGFMWFGTKDGLARYDGYSFKVYKNDPGDSTTISHNKIWSIYEDQSEILWIGTETGLDQFDRHSETFIRYLPNSNDSTSLSVSTIHAILEDHSGAFWIGSGDGPQSKLGGLYKLDRPDSLLIKSHESRGKVTRYYHDPKNPNSLSDNAVRGIVEDDAGALWAGTEQHGLNRLDPRTKTFTRYVHDPTNPHSLSNDQVLQALKDKDDRLWFATLGGGLNRYDPNTDGFVRYQHHRQDSNSLRHNYIEGAVFQDASGMLWIANGVLSRLDPSTGLFKHIQFSSSQDHWLSSYAPYGIYEDRSHNLWVGTRDQGVFHLDLKPKKFAHYQHEPGNPNSLSDNDVAFLYEDSKGNIWIATREQGLNLFDPKSENFTHFKHDRNDPESLNHNSIDDIHEDHTGAIWIGTRSGLNRFDPKRNRFVRYQHDPTNPLSLNDNRVITILEDRAGVLWVGAATGGLNKFDRQNGKFFHFKPDPRADDSYGTKAIYALFEDRRDNLWVLTFFEVYHFDRRAHRFTRLTAAPNDEPWGKSNFLFEDRRGTVWGGVYGLCKLDPDKKQFRRYRVSPNENRSIQSIYEDESSKLWCGTSYGLYQFDTQQEQFIAHYGEKHGLSDNFVLKIIGDHSGNLWLLTKGGLCLFDPGAPPGRQFKTLGPNDGIINTPYNYGAFIKTKSGEIYWGGANGIYRFFPEINSTNPCAPAIRLTEFKKFNKTVKPDTAIAEIKTFRLKYNENFFSFAFAALDYTDPQRNQYAYKLEGFDTDWIQIGNKREASYTNVPPGGYVFRAKGSNSDGVWNEKGVSVKIIITPPFWQTWWFRLLILGMIAAALEALHKYRVAKKLEIEHTRLRIARDLHDDVGSSLSSIALTAELLQKESATDSLANRRLTRVHETAQKLSRNLKEIVWAIDPQRDKFDDLLLHMKEAAEELLGQKGIAYTFDLPQEELPHSLKMEFRRNLFLIYKEMLHNVVKHSAATKVEIALTRMNGTLQLQVADNGKGFCTEAAGNGNGMKSMQARAGELNGKLEIDSRLERGTRMRLAVSCK